MKGHIDNYDYRKHKRTYGLLPDGSEIQPPKGWVILPEYTEVPHRHREFYFNERGRYLWCEPRVTISTMTPIFAIVWGHVLVYAVPEDCDISNLKKYQLKDTQ